MADTNSAILDLLGLTDTVNSVKNVVTATKDGVAALNATKELLASAEGEKFKATIIALMGGTTVKPDGSVHVDVKKPEAHQEDGHLAKGHYEFDGFANPPWVWVPD